MAQKTYEELTFVDDFMFAKVMRNKKLCKRLLEVILKVKIKDISYIEEQKTIDQIYDAKSVRLDVYVEDDKNSVYDCEMQTSDPKNLPKRSRYYQGIIDLNLIEKGEDYNRLKKSFVIFICTKDIFDKGRHIYTFENRCVEDPSIELGDETVKIFLNASSTMDDVDEELDGFLNYVASGSPTDEFTKELEAEVGRARENRDWEVEYMKYMVLRSELLAEGRAEGRIEGIIEGRIEGRAEGRTEGRTEGMSQLAAAIQALKRGETAADLLEQGYDQKTIDLALVCR